MVQAARSDAGKSKSNGKAPGRLNTLGRFYVDKVNEKVMREAVKAFLANEVMLDADSTAEQIAVTLTLHFREKIAAEDMCKCEVCGGEAPAEYGGIPLPACPFCGEESAPMDDEEVAVNGAEVTSPETVLGADAEDTKTTKKKAAKETAMATSKKAAAKTTAKEKPSTGMVKAMSVGLVSNKELDARVEEIIALKSAAATSYWELGRRILEIYEKSLWKLRLNEEGKARYSSFDAFSHHELKMSPTNALGMISWAKQYSAEDIAQMGHTKAALIMKAPPQDRAALTEEAKKGASKKTIATKVAAAKKQRGYEGATAQAKAGGKGAKARAEKLASKKDVAQDKITIAKIEGLRTLPLYAKPASLKNLNLKDCKRAKTLEALPFGRLELINGVAMYISIVKGKDGFLSAKVDTRRESTID